MSLKSIPYTLPSSRNCIVNPRQLDLISHRSKRISWMSSTVSVLIFTTYSLVSSTQSLTVMLLDGPHFRFCRVDLITMASSPHTMLQLEISEEHTSELQ